MNEKTKKIVYSLLAVAAFIVSLGLVIIGQRNIGLTGLLTMFAGLAGLIILLWIYNRRYR